MEPTLPAVPINPLASPVRRPSVSPMGQFPSMKAADFLRLLQRELGYRIVRQEGSHRKLEADGRPTLTFAFHDRVSLPPRMVRKILVNDVGMSEDQAKRLL